MEDLVFQKIGDTMTYCRSVSNQSIGLANALLDCYPFKSHNHGDHTRCIVTPSGTSAISISVHSLLLRHPHQSINVVRGSELYSCTPKIFKYLAKIFQINLHTIDVNDSDAILTLFQNLNNQINILFVESASNSSGDIFDFTLIKKLRSMSKKLYVVVDNTWLTHIIFNPFDYDADIIVTSLTKYYTASAIIL